MRELKPAGSSLGAGGLGPYQDADGIAELTEETEAALEASPIGPLLFEPRAARG